MISVSLRSESLRFYKNSLLGAKRIIGWPTNLRIYCRGKKVIKKRGEWTFELLGNINTFMRNPGSSGSPIPK